MADNTERSSVRLATLGELRKNILPNFLAPVPSNDTLRSWFDSARIPRFKSNPGARRGGGSVFYSTAAVEKFLRSRTLPPSSPENKKGRLLTGPKQALTWKL
jgi:hypothetical protein